MSFVTRRLGKVITCLSGVGGGGKMDLGGKGFSPSSAGAVKGLLGMRYCKVGFEILALN